VLKRSSAQPTTGRRSSVVAVNTENRPPISTALAPKPLLMTGSPKYRNVNGRDLKNSGRCNAWADYFISEAVIAHTPRSLDWAPIMMRMPSVRPADTCSLYLARPLPCLLMS